MAEDLPAIFEGKSFKAKFLKANSFTQKKMLKNAVPIFRVTFSGSYLCYVTPFTIFKLGEMISQLGNVISKFGGVT